MDLKVNSLEDAKKAFLSYSSKETELEDELQRFMKQHDQQENKVLSLEKILPHLQLVHSDAEQLSDMVAFTSTLAENISQKVKKLDVTRTRVVACMQRVEDILDLKFCTDGVQTALHNEDYEQAAAHIHRFLSLDQTVLRKSAADSKEGSSLEEAFRRLHEAEGRLRALVMRQFDEAVRDGDGASAERFFKIFPLLNQHQEGLGKFATYLCSQIAEKSQKNLQAAASLSPSDKRWAVKYADLATLLFEGIARIIEIHQPLVETYYGPGRLFSVVEILQKECDRQIKKVLEEFKTRREYAKKAHILQQLNKMPYKTADRLDPRDLDTLLAEVTILSTRAQLYLRFIRRRVTGDIEISTTDDDVKKEALGRLNRMLKECELSRLMHDILGTYVTMEEYFMRESIHKAVSLDTIEENAITSSMLDDIFFIIKKCLKRSISSSSADVVCAMLNHTTALLQSDFYELLHERIRLGLPSSGMLDYSVFHTSSPDQARTEFLVTLNNAEVACEFVRTLRTNLEEDVQKIFSHASDQDVAKLENVLSEIISVNAKLQQLISHGRNHMCAALLKPRIKTWADALESAPHIITEDDLVQFEANDGARPFIQHFIIHTDSFLKSLQSSLTTSNFDALVSLFASELTSQFEKSIMQCRFNRLGGLQLERELRLLVAYLASLTTWTVRDKFARLTQITALLNLEKVTEILDTWGHNSGSLTWRLSPTEVRQILELRKDFKPEDIKRLKL